MDDRGHGAPGPCDRELVRHPDGPPGFWGHGLGLGFEPPWIYEDDVLIGSELLTST
jgi:hypothetical protein